MTEKDALKSFQRIMEGPLEEYQFLRALKNEVDDLQKRFLPRLPRRTNPPTQDQLVSLALKNMKKWYKEGNETKVPLSWKYLAKWIPGYRVTQLWCVALRKYHISECK